MMFPPAGGIPAQASTAPLVLIVEDEFFVRMVAAEALRDAGHRVIEADNADEALAILQGGVPVDLVFSDVRMPGSIDGLGLLAVIQDDCPSTPVLICSGHLDPRIALASGAHGFIAKPYRIDEMLKQVDNCLRGEPQSRESASSSIQRMRADRRQ